MTQQIYRSPWARKYNPPRKQKWTREYYLAALAILAIALVSWTVAAEVPEESVNTEAGNVTYHGGRNLSNLAP